MVLLNNRYQLEQRLGAGGMASIFLAQDLTLERRVAIKLLREDFSGDAAFRARFHQEAKAAANLTHPNIVTVHDFGLDTVSGRLFIVMEYVPGPDLKALLRQRGRFTVEEAIPLLIQACAGIGYAHRAGLVHCDVKPHNLIVTPDQRLKVTDFGIARALASIQPDEKNSVVWGSPQYFAPEQAAGGAPSPASDVYSLGVILYELLCGQLPFISESPGEFARLHRETPPPPPRQINPAIPPVLEEIILKVLSKEPAARYRTADQLGRVLIAYTKGGQSVQASQTISSAAATSASAVAVTRQAPVPPPPPPRTAAPPLRQPPPAERPLPPAQVEEEGEEEEPAENPLDIDWITWGLALLALLAVGGLIPLWLWVYLVYNPPR